MIAGRSQASSNEGPQESVISFSFRCCKISRQLPKKAARPIPISFRLYEGPSMRKVSKMVLVWCYFWKSPQRANSDWMWMKKRIDLLKIGKGTECEIADVYRKGQSHAPSTGLRGNLRFCYLIEILRNAMVPTSNKFLHVRVCFLAITLFVRSRPGSCTRRRMFAKIMRVVYTTDNYQRCTSWSSAEEIKIGKDVSIAF